MALLAVTAENRVLIQANNISGSQTALIRWPLTIGSAPVDSLLLSDLGWYKNASPSYVVIPNAFTVVSAAIEDGIVSVPVTKGGSRTWVVNPGDNDSQSDLVLASQFSRANFTQGLRLWLKMELSFASTGMSLPFSDRVTTHVTGSQVLHFNQSGTTIVNGVDTVGTFTTSGTAPTSTTAGYCPMVLGNYSGGVVPKVIYANGDSILRGFGDTSNTPIGSGMFQRILYGAGANSNILSGINFARDGSFSTDYLNVLAGDKIAMWSKYCTVAIDEYSTNDFGISPGTSQTAATQLQRAQDTATKMRTTYGVQKIIRTKLGLSTTSTSGNWTSDADQTVVAAWAAGGRVADFNNGLDALVPAYYDAVVPMNAWRSGTDQYKWVSTGANRYGTTDGGHPTTVIYTALASEVRTYVDALVLAVPGASGGNNAKRLRIGVGVGI
jgi:lysophospholipase L1-like esterase